MIVLDTDVLSEPLRARPSAEVLAWLESQTETLALTAISVGELLTGVRLLPASRRQAGVEDGMIAAICLARGASLATRNLKDFDDLGLDVIDPWDVRPGDVPPRR